VNDLVYYWYYYFDNFFLNSGRKNACRVMSFDPEIQTGDAAAFDMKLDNKVFNQLRSQSRQLVKKTHRALDRKENMETTQMGLDEPTRLILYKMINNQLLESVDGVVSTGKEAIILHGETDANCPDRSNLPKEVAIKIFSTTLNEFKQRDRYIKDDFRFKDRFSKQNNRTVIGMWAEKELHNLNRLKKAEILCPDVVALKKHVLVMSFIGKDSRAAPKLKEAALSVAELICAYDEIVQIMCKMYQEAKLVHADFSEYNILWWDGKLWVIDVAQAVEPIHPSALEFLMRDCANITNFFSKRGVPDVKSKEDLFFQITNLDPLTSNTTMLEKIHMKGEPVHVMTRPKSTDENAQVGEIPEQFKPVEFPFDYAWTKVENMKKKKRRNSGKTVVDNSVVDLGKEISVSHSN
jgi:RIO kinase 3